MTGNRQNAVCHLRNYVIVPMSVGNGSHINSYLLVANEKLTRRDSEISKANSRLAMILSYAYSREAEK